MVLRIATAGVAVALLSCSPGPNASSETHFVQCDSDADCTGLGSAYTCVQQTCRRTTTESPEAGKDAETSTSFGPHPTGLLGRVRAYIIPEMADAPAFSTIDVRFFDELHPTGCREEVEGCTFERCIYYSTYQQASTFLSVGKWSVTSGGTRYDCFQSQTSCDFLTYGGELWHAGDSLEFQFDGDLLPPFRATTVMPAALPMPAAGPTDSGSSYQSIRRDQPFVATWPSQPGSVRVVLTQPGGTRAVTQTFWDDWNIELECAFPGEAGTGTVPAAALARLDPGRVTVAVKPVSDVIADADGYGVRVRAENLGASTDMVIELDATDGGRSDAGVPQGCMLPQVGMCEAPFTGIVCDSTCPTGCWFYGGSVEQHVIGCCCP